MWMLPPDTLARLNTFHLQVNPQQSDLERFAKSGFFSHSKYVIGALQLVHCNQKESTSRVIGLLP